MFTLKANHWIMEQALERLEKIEKNFNTLNECCRYAEKRGCDEYKVFTHQSELCHWVTRPTKPCDLS